MSTSNNANLDGIAADGIVLDRPASPETETPALDGKTDEPLLETETNDEKVTVDEEKPVADTNSTSDFGVKTESEYVSEATVLEKRIADKETFINVLKTRVEGGEQVIKTLTEKLNNVLGFFSNTPEEADPDKFIEIQKSIPSIKGEITQNLALVKLRSAASQLDLNSEEAEKVNRSLKEDGYDADTISRSSDKSILYYIKSVVEEYRQARSVSSSASVPNSDVKDLKDLIAQQQKELKELKELLVKKPETQPEVKPKAKLSKPPVATPSGTGGKAVPKNDSFMIAGDVRI